MLRSLIISGGLAGLAAATVTAVSGAPWYYVAAAYSALGLTGAGLLAGLSMILPEPPQHERKVDAEIDLDLLVIEAGRYRSVRDLEDEYLTLRDAARFQHQSMLSPAPPLENHPGRAEAGAERDRIQRDVAREAEMLAKAGAEHRHADSKGPSQ